jgi:hypothetical protein
VLKQNATLRRLEEYLEIPLAKVIVNRQPIGRWKTDEGRHHFGFLEDDMRELGYRLPARRSSHPKEKTC